MSIAENPLPLNAQDIHIWKISLPDTSSAATTKDLLLALSLDERDIYYEFTNPAHQNQYLYSRAHLRLTLSKYHSLAPTEWHFSRSDNGKPYITNSGCTLTFNISHSSHQLIIAIGRDHQLGVDIEEMKTSRNWQEIANTYYSEAEVTTLRSLNKEDSCRYFYKLWTLKEAYIKALDSEIGASHLEMIFADTATEDTINGPQGWTCKHLGFSDNFSLAIGYQQNKSVIFQNTEPQ